MQNMNVTSHGVTCQLTATKRFLEEVKTDSFIHHYIPDVVLNEPANPDVTVTMDGKLEKIAKIDFPNASFRPEVDMRSAISLVGYLLERARQEKRGIYSLSSACASYHDSAVVFWGGATNLGKTSSMLELVMNNDFDFFSDEKTLIDLDEQRIVGGSRSVAARKEPIRLKVGSTTEFHHLTSVTGPKNAHLLIYPHLDHGLADPIHYPLPPEEFHWLLSRELGGTIRGTTKFMDNYAFPLPPLDTEDLAIKRNNSVRNFTRRVPCYYFQGSAKQVAAFVRRKIQDDKEK